jgi:tetratricopeptide (TPR) repeat protein
MSFLKRLLGVKPPKEQKDANHNVPTLSVSEELQPHALKTIAKTGDKYVDDCFHIGFQEFDEPRRWNEIPEAQAITGPGNAGRLEEALRLAKALQNKYPDFYYSYYWFAVLYRKQARYDSARSALTQGLEVCKSKYKLCQMMGDTEWETGNLPEAVKWWIKNIVIQVSVHNLDDYVSFLHLSYVAEQLGLPVASSRLRQYVDRIRYGEIRLNPDAANKLYTGTRRQGTESMKRAIDLLDREYLS